MDYPKPKRLGILIGLCTGMRIGEICGLRWENIDVDNKCIHVTHTIERIMDIDTRKTKVIESTPKTIESRRDIPIGRDLLGILKNSRLAIMIVFMSLLEMRSFVSQGFTETITGISF